MGNNNLIDRNTLLDDLRLLAKYQPEDKASTILGVCVTIKARPVVHAEPVIRCNICKHYETDTGYCNIHNHGMDWDDFCSRGEKVGME